MDRDNDLNESDVQVSERRVKNMSKGLETERIRPHRKKATCQAEAARGNVLEAPGGAALLCPGGRVPVSLQLLTIPSESPSEALPVRLGSQGVGFRRTQFGLYSFSSTLGPGYHPPFDGNLKIAISSCRICSR